MRAEANIATISVPGDLDVLAAPALKRSLEGLIDGGCRRVVVNMANAGYVDSAGMGTIICELKHMRQEGGLISLVNVAPRVYRALALMRVMDFMPVSRADMRRSVRELDPSVLPEWRRTFRVAAGQMARVRGRVEYLCEGLPLTADEVFDLTLAVGEALGNAVDHAGERGVLVTVAAYADRVVVDVADCGQGFSLGPDEELPEAATDAERGRGIKLMRMLADSASISPKSTGEGSVTHLVKLFSNSVVAR